LGGGLGGAKVQKVHIFATKLAKSSVKQMETTAIRGGGWWPLPPEP